MIFAPKHVKPPTEQLLSPLNLDKWSFMVAAQGPPHSLFMAL